MKLVRTTWKCDVCRRKELESTIRSRKSQWCQVGFGALLEGMTDMNHVCSFECARKLLERVSKAYLANDRGGDWVR